MDVLVEEKALFKNFKFARDVTDVTFQQSYRISGSLQEGKWFFCGKQKLYGYEVATYYFLQEWILWLEITTLVQGTILNLYKTTVRLIWIRQQRELKDKILMTLVHYPRSILSTGLY